MITLIEEDGNQRSRGTICSTWIEWHLSWAGENMADPICELQELEAVFDYLKTQFPKGWEIKEGKVIAYDSPSGKDRADGAGQPS